METDVLIIGGGPAGLAAAYETGSRGLNVTVIEQSWSLGGQLRSQTQLLSDLPDSYSNFRGIELSARLIERLKPYNVTFLMEHTFIGMYQDGSLGVSGNQQVFPISASKVIFATGAAEEAVPFPKWTLPGVMTVGAAQIFINRERVLPGRSCIVAGSSDFALETILQLHEVGVNIKGVVEKTGQLKAKKIENINKIKALHIPIFLNTEIDTAEGKDKVEKVVLKQEENLIEIDVDFVCTDGGFHPIIEPFQLAGCNLNYENGLGGWLPDYNQQLRTSNEAIYAAGNATGISCLGSIILTGSIAGLSAAEALEAVSSFEASKLKNEIWMKIEAIESSYDYDIWKSRTKHMKLKHVTLY